MLIGAGVLDADVPLPASNVLLKALGMILDLAGVRVVQSPKLQCTCSHDLGRAGGWISRSLAAHLAPGHLPVG